MHYDLAIIGYGPSGAVAANLFGAKGYKILVVEPKEEIWDIPRAVHLAVSYTHLRAHET